MKDFRPSHPYTPIFSVTSVTFNTGEGFLAIQSVTKKIRCNASSLQKAQYFQGCNDCNGFLGGIGD
jgi:hypothetical protein